MKCFVATILLLLGGARESVVKMPNNSMEPTIKMGSAVRIDETYYSKNSIQRFDIVVVKDPDGRESRYVKRIIGLGGERFQIKNGKILVNGEPLKEPFVSIPPEDDFEPISVPNGEYFLLGDNRANSYDSRYWKKKTVSKDGIYAKVIGFELK
jgi:signal peptidase I